MRVVFVANGFVWNPFIEIEIEPARSPRWYLDARYQAVSLFSPGAITQPRCGAVCRDSGSRLGAVFQPMRIGRRLSRRFRHSPSRACLQESSRSSGGDRYACIRPSAVEGVEEFGASPEPSNACSHPTLSTSSRLRIAIQRRIRSMPANIHAPRPSVWAPNHRKPHGHE